MTDIVERLRKDRMPLPYQTVLEAADEIERLRADNDDLRRLVRKLEELLA